MNRPLKRRILLLVLMSLMSLGLAARSSGFDEIRAVQILLLLSSGLCLGVALSLFMQQRGAGLSSGEQREG